MKLLWRKWYVKAAVATVVVVALLAVVWFGALKPTYTADEVTKKMQAYLSHKVYEQWPGPSGDGFSRTMLTTTCEGVLGRRLATHYIPYRKAWRITVSPYYTDGTYANHALVLDEQTLRITSSVEEPDYTYANKNYTWLFDERTGMIASSSGQC